MTAFGTVGAVIVALGIALWTERRSDRRVREERAHSDRVLAEQREHERAAIEDERAHGAAQLEEERKIVRSGSNSPRLMPCRSSSPSTLARSQAERARSSNSLGDPATRRRLVNHGSYAITGVEVQFCLGQHDLSPDDTNECPTSIAWRKR